MESKLRHVQSIVIVGGGSSGWMTAAYLSQVLFDVDIKLIESPTTPTIGVGEATFPFIRSFLARIGLNDDRAWMSQCDSTFKTGIFYKNWYAQGDTYWHPLFEDLDYINGDVHTGHCWMHMHQRQHPAYRDRRSFFDACFATTTLNVLNNRIPAGNEYAYHINVAGFTKLLKSAAPRLRHIVDHVGDVKLNQQGEIEALTTASSGELKADLYIDCTGFRRHLIRQVAPELQFTSNADSLFCDSAVVLHMPYTSEHEKKTQMQPFVTCSAQSAGWIWTIPLFSEISSGYVHASRFISTEQAELELRRYWGEERTRDLTSIKVKFVNGKLERFWVANCVAIGLAGGFIEPLESPGLAITQLGVEMLASMLDARYYEQRMIDRYNAHLEKFYDDIVQFLIIHYYFTSRQDTPFWQAVKQETVIPEALQARLDVFKRYLPTFNTRGTSEVWMFKDLSWFSVLLGMNFAFDTQAVNEPDLLAFKLLLDDKRQGVEDLLARLPNHYEYLSKHVYGKRR